MINRTTILAALVAALALGACAAPARSPEPTPAATAEEPAETVETIYIAPALKDCTGVAPMRCMEVATSPDGPWTLFYGAIEGFTFEEGYRYELKVRTEAVANPPADGSATRTILVEVVSKTAAAATAPAGDELAGTSWNLSSIDGAAPAEGGQPASIAFTDEGRVAGSSGCNRFMGGYTLSDGALAFGALAGTMMACPEPLMQQEQAFLAILGAASGHSVAGDTLTITADDGRSLVFTRA